MKRIIVLTGCLIAASFFIGCHSSSEEEVLSQKKPAKKEYILKKDSELSLLMRKMYADNLKLRNQLLQGNLPQRYPDYLEEIHTAQPTVAEKKGKAFAGLADLYLTNMDDFTSKKSVGQAQEAYNTAINTCVSCHQLYCHGPLEKIRKLIIPLEK